MTNQLTQNEISTFGQIGYSIQKETIIKQRSVISDLSVLLDSDSISSSFVEPKVVEFTTFSILDRHNSPIFSEIESEDELISQIRSLIDSFNSL